MKTKFDADDLNLVSLAKEYSNEKKARKLFESLRWPGGKPVCPHCGFEETYKLKSKPDSKTKLRAGVYCCAACRKPFSATVSTVFENSHVPISKILMAIFILCSSKKSVSALQLSRMLRTTYRTAWFLAHRIRFAMATDLKASKSRRKIRNTLTGTMMARRFIARCWFSNAPPQVSSRIADPAVACRRIVVSEPHNGAPPRTSGGAIRTRRHGAGVGARPSS